jgi:cobalt-zinc-cadmium efflux system protein
VLAGIAIYWTGATWLDPLLSGLISLLILRSAWDVLRETVDILMEATPRDVDMPALVDDVLGIAGVLGLHDLHVWSVSRGLRTMSAHIQVEDSTLRREDDIRGQISQLLERRYGISHTTLQLEFSACDDADLYCEMDSIPKASAH